MSDLTDLTLAALEILTDLGTTATLQVVSSDYDNAGTVTETVVEHEVVCSDLLNESRQYVADGTSPRTMGLFVIAASGLEVTPALGDRVEYQSRTFSILSVDPMRVEGGVVAYSLSVGEVTE